MKGDGNIEIKIVGSNCSIGRRLMKKIKDVSVIQHKDVVIRELNQNKDKVYYHVNLIPALIVDDRIISQGKVLSDKEIKKLILSFD